MTREELIKYIRVQQQRQGRADVFVFLTLPGDWGRRTTAPLFGKRGPRGRIVGQPQKGRIIVDFKGTDILHYLGEPIEAAT